ncbi:MAG: hypothetical protein HQK95_04815 [Nitrospirae bacterium]|nr:hypothetical protein [Nitrospirota bacterium]
MPSTNGFPSKGWLKCSDISEGMFPNEYAVESITADNAEFSLFAHKTLVNEKEKLLKVTILDCRDDVCLVILPNEAYGVFKNMITVKIENISQ